MTIRNGIGLLSAALGACTLFGGGTASADDFAVSMDQMRLLTFSAPVKTVLVANPVIADVTVIDNRRVFVLGKNFGVTNLVALDAAGKEIANDQVIVSGRAGTVVTLQRGPAETTFACNDDHCRAAPVPGDDKGPFDEVAGQIEKRDTLSKSASSQ